MIKFGKSLAFLVFLFAEFFSLSVETIREQGADSLGKNGELILLHTNDYHGAVLSNNRRGGLAEVSVYVKAVKAVNPQVVLLDAGDVNTGSALSNLFSTKPDILGYNIMDYDAGTFGNHEFDGNQEKLLTQIGLAKYPFISSNIKTADGNFLGGNQYIVKKYNGFSDCEKPLYLPIL